MVLMGENYVDTTTFKSILQNEVKNLLGGQKLIRVIADTISSGGLSRCLQSRIQKVFESHGP